MATDAFASVVVSVYQCTPRSIAHMFTFVNRIMLDCVLFIIGLLQIVVHVMQILFGCLGGFLFVFTYSDTLPLENK